MFTHFLLRRSISLTIIIVCFFLVPVAVAYADTSQVITFGADLNSEQKALVARKFGVNLQDTAIPLIEVTNAEERRYLQGLVPNKVIGSRAISSAMVEVLPAGSGVTVQTHNITWVTTDMFENAVVTAKVKDARIIAAAPFPVSGTAALTGIFKAFETATGQKLDEESKKTANEELVRTGELGEAIGKEKATELMLKVKERVIADKVTDPEQIKQIIINVAGDLNINLTPAQIDQITQLMQKISKLDLNIRDISSQLQDLKTKLDDVIAQNKEVKSILQQILDALNGLIEKIRAWFGL
ncbi:hypothetical protein Tfer_2971 [Thermincola ferriacetica]|uniref:DUF1002 domain-containing protein n=1 Tax=Thermincola ferriacetica TaxID=281456 RepID=A0A0L6VZ25_9FIRM|nr:DUF1002 domain-containing protein [Thermincola ferriacetica]KNZ68451.1 hypothetical protein Tfer_2971 [Thermincola ferriacetica]